MAVKLMMTWDMLPGREQEYFEFIVREFLPGMQTLGLETSDAWLTMYGRHPQIATAAQMPSLAEMQRVLGSPEWQSLVNRLLDFVEHYDYKIIEARAGFQM